jgi:hypothetical protein
MTDHIRDRINRKLDTLSEERLYQILDYVEFLESKYAVRPAPAANAFQKFAEGIEDKMRAGRMSATTIAETMGLLNRAAGMLNGVAAAGKSVAADLANAAQRVSTVVADATAQAGTVIGTTPPDPNAPPATNPPTIPPTTPPASPAPPAPGAGPGATPGESRS